MTAQRLIQNFRGMRAVLSSGAADPLPASLESPLLKLGMTLALVGRIELASLKSDRDILLLDGDGDLDAADLLAPGATLPPAPVVGLVGVEAPSRLKALHACGATAFLRKPVHGAAVYSCLFLAVNGFHRLREMEQRLIEHDRRRHGRRWIIKAVTHLMATRGLNDDEAYEYLRRESMRSRLGIEDFCQALLAPSATSQRDNDDATEIAANGGLAGHARLAGRGGAGG